MELHIYADDTQIYTSVCPTSNDGLNQAVSKIEQCVCEVQEWMTQNFLKLNAAKTEVQVFGFRAQLSKLTLPSVSIAGIDIAIQADPVKDLGVMLDRGMSMSAQVTKITKAANYHLTNIGRVRKMLTAESTKLVVHSLVTSRLDYCNSLLVGISESQVKRLINVQRTAARLIRRKRKFDPITSDLIDLHWLPIRQRIDFKILVLVYKSCHKQSPDYITEMLQRKTSCRQLRSTASSTPSFIERRTSHSTFADRSFSCYAPRVWNKLPEIIRDAESVNFFRKLLKRHLFEIAYKQ